jgi:hypothetical protein
MESIEKLLMFFLGAGKGYLGTIIRVALAGGAGHYVSRGVVSADVASGIVDALAAIILTALAVVGSRLNAKAVSGK